VGVRGKRSRVSNYLAVYVAGRFALNSLFGALAGAFLTLAGFISGVIAAHTLGVSGSGAVAYKVWLALVVASILDLGASWAVGRYVPEMRARGEDSAAERLSGYLARVLTASVTGAMALFVAIVLWPHLKLPGLPRFAAGLLQANETPGACNADALWALLALYVAVQVFGTYAYAYLRGRQRFREAFRLAGLSFVLQTAGVAGGSMTWGVCGAIAGYIAGQILPAISAVGLVARAGPLDDALSSRVRYYAGYAWAANVANIFVWSRLEIFFLERYAGIHDVGIFAAALTLSSLATQGPILLTAGVLTLLSEKRGRSDHEGMQAAMETGTRLLAALILPACLGTAAIMPVLVPLIYGPAFVEAIPAAIVLVCAASVSAIAVVSTNLVHAMERSDFVFFSGAIGAVLAVLSSLVLVPQFGLMGAVLSRVATQTLIIAAGLWFIITRLKYPMPFANLSRLLGAAAISAGIAWLLVAWFAHPLILIVAVPAALTAYVIALRGLSALPVSDLILLHRLSRALPTPAAQLGQQLLNFIGGSIIKTHHSSR
jgi:O-antigen/teichoic acid export membrane protein